MYLEHHNQKSSVAPTQARKTCAADEASQGSVHRFGNLATGSCVKAFLDPTFRYAGSVHANGKAPGGGGGDHHEPEAKEVG